MVLFPTDLSIEPTHIDIFCRTRVILKQQISSADGHYLNWLLDIPVQLDRVRCLVLPFPITHLEDQASYYAMDADAARY